MPIKRTDRLNSLLKEVLSEVIREEVRNPHISTLVTVTRVEITTDLHYAKVFVSVIGSEQEKQAAIAGLQSAAGFIAVHAAKKVVMRYFPDLTFRLDDSVEKYAKIEQKLREIQQERELRESSPSG